MAIRLCNKKVCPGERLEGCLIFRSVLLGIEDDRGRTDRTREGAILLVHSPATAATRPDQAVETIRGWGKAPLPMRYCLLCNSHQGVTRRIQLPALERRARPPSFMNKQGSARACSQRALREFFTGRCLPGKGWMGCIVCGDSHAGRSHATPCPRMLPATGGDRVT